MSIIFRSHYKLWSHW